jgi:pimeloyl-ACP methyl ester carboxylesterase
MTTAVIENQKPAGADRDQATGSVVSRDGTTIGYRQLGRGPGLVILHGAMESAKSHLHLAQELAATFTVYLPDRRGRGLSGRYALDPVSQTEVEDLEALLTKTGAPYLFGVSSGAIIGLRAALSLPAIQKAALFEPPFMFNGTAPTTMFTRLDREIAEGRIASALITGMKAAQLGPPLLDHMPRWLLERLTEMMMANEEKKAGPDEVTMRMLAPTLQYDFQLVIEMAGALASFRAIRAGVLLLGGSKSPAYLKAALDSLQKLLPGARRVEFPGLGHEASGNADRRGRPERVAQELRRFFAEPQNVYGGTKP